MEIAGVQMKGKYSDCGRGFSTIGRRLGVPRRPMLAYHYDNEYKEDDADFRTYSAPAAEQAAKNTEGIAIRDLPGGKCVSLFAGHTIS